MQKFQLLWKALSVATRGFVLQKAFRHRVLRAEFSLITAIVLILAVMPMFNSVWALECRRETLFYNNEKDEKIFAEADLFADDSPLGWGTEVCPVNTHKRWLTTWIQVRLEDGATGWLDNNDLVTLSDFQDSARSQHAARIEELNAMLAEIADVEGLMEDLQIAVPKPELRTLLRSWLGQAPPAEDTEPADSKVSAPEHTPTPKPTLKPTATPRPTRTPRPTATLRPTATPRPTRTPRPTATLRPTSTPTPVDLCTSGDIAFYRNAMLEHLDTVTETSLALQTQFAKISENPALIFNDEWILETSIWLVTLRLLHEDVEDMTVPARMRTGHNHMLEATGSLDRATYELATGIDNVDSEALTRGINLITGASASFEAANAAWQQVCK